MCTFPFKCGLPILCYTLGTALTIKPSLLTRFDYDVTQDWQKTNAGRKSIKDVERQRTMVARK